MLKEGVGFASTRIYRSVGEKPRYLCTEYVVLKFVYGAWSLTLDTGEFIDKMFWLERLCGTGG